MKRLAEEITQIESDRYKLPALFELADLEMTSTDSKYATALRQEFKNKYPQWEPFVELRLDDHKPFAKHSNVELKRVLDVWFPVPGLNLETLLTSKRAKGQYGNDTEVEISPFTHIDTLFESESTKWCCEQLEDGLGELDFVELVEAWAVSNILKSIRLRVVVQGNPSAAERVLDDYEKLLNGHPYFTNWRAYVASELVSIQGDSASSITYSYFIDKAKEAIVWSAGQHWASYSPLEQFVYLEERGIRQPDSTTGRNLRDYAYMYSYDFPIRWYWPRWGRGSEATPQKETLKRLLKYTNSFFPYVEDFYRHIRGSSESSSTQQETQALLTEIESRFLGNHRRAKFLSSVYEEQDGVERAMEFLRQEISDGHLSWFTLHTLATYQVKAGQFDKAAETLWLFPSFNETPLDLGVAESNYAYIAGSLFYWKAEHQYAAEFFKLSAESGTGSEGSLKSGARLAIIEGDYAEAAAWFSRAINRYTSSTTSADFISLLHLLGYSEHAWALFHESVGHFQDPLVWNTALDAHRMDGKTTEEIAGWTKTESLQSLLHRGRRFPVYFLIRSGLTDRTPDKQLVTALSVADADSVGTMHYEAPAYMHRDGYTVGPSQFAGLYKSLVHQAGARAPGAYTEMLMNAYLAVHKGDFREAYSLFHRKSQYYFNKHPVHVSFGPTVFRLVRCKNQQHRRHGLLPSVLRRHRLVRDRARLSFSFGESFSSGGAG